MTSRIGTQASASSSRARTQAFTLIELILVMALLAVVLGIGAPSLSRFFRGRALDSEARRIVSLTHYGQSRAASEGVPVTLWFDEEEGRYGLQAEMTTDLVDSNAVELVLAEGLRFEFEAALPTVRRAQTTEQPLRLRTGAALPQGLPTIRFEPDGFLGEDSVERVLLWQRDEDSVWVGQGRDRMHYEILTNEPPITADRRTR